MKFGAIVVDGRGKIGGHVASKNRAGAYLRTKVTPVNPNTVAQQNVRAILSSLSTGWAELTSAQRLGWNEAVADFATTDIFGDTKNPSGFNLYVKLNSNLINSGQAPIGDVPVKAEIPYTELVTAEISLGDDTFVLGFDSTAYAGARIFVTATPSLSNGITNVKSKMRGIGSYTVVADTQDIWADYLAKFGTPVDGSNIVVGVEVILPNGQKGVKQTLKANYVL